MGVIVTTGVSVGSMVGLVRFAAQLQSVFVIHKGLRQ